MKVTTEACLFGAWVDTCKKKRILDIGAGTGLLSLMLAQRSDAMIDAVEINEQAASQCRENFLRSPWPKRLNGYHTSIQDFFPPGQYDLIICNPPFYLNSLPTSDHEKNEVRHVNSLTFETLAQSVSRLLSPGGHFHVLMPEHESKLFSEAALREGLFMNTQLRVLNQSGAAKIFRLVTSFSRNETELTENSFAIRKGHEYSREFKKLLRDYYLLL